MPQWVSMLVLGPWMLLLFIAIGQAADSFFAPAVVVFSDKLKLAPDVAGATLLALGNGAADFFTQIAAITSSSEVDLPLALGESVGAAVYVCTLAMALVIFVSPREVRVPAGPYVRDTVFYLVAVSMVAEMIADSNFELYESATLVVWYLMYLLAVFYGEALFPASFGMPDAAEPGEEREMLRVDVAEDESAPGSASREGLKLEIDERAHLREKDDYEYAGEDSVLWLKEQLSPWTMSAFGALVSPLTAPVTLLLTLTMPPMEVRNVGKPHAVVMGIFAPVLLYVCFVLEPKDFGALDVLVMLGMSVTGGYITYFTFPAGGATPRNSMFLTGMAFLMGIAWMDIAADELVAVLETIGRVLGLPDAFLGATVLAWGASAGDTAALLATAQSGHGGMAISACFAGPLFQLLIGTGCSLMYVGVFKGDVLMTIHSNLPAMFGFTIILMLFLCLAVPLHFKFRFTKSLAGILVAGFFAYAALMACTGFGILVLV